MRLLYIVNIGKNYDHSNGWTAQQPGALKILIIM